MGMCFNAISISIFVPLDGIYDCFEIIKIKLSNVESIVWDLVEWALIIEKVRRKFVDDCFLTMIDLSIPFFFIDSILHLTFIYSIFTRWRIYLHQWCIIVRWTLMDKNNYWISELLFFSLSTCFYWSQETNHRILTVRIIGKKFPYCIWESTMINI